MEIEERKYTIVNVISDLQAILKEVGDSQIDDEMWHEAQCSAEHITHNYPKL